MDIKQEDLIKFWSWCGKKYHTLLQTPELTLDNIYQYALPNLEYFEVRGQLYLHSRFACAAMVRTFAGKPHKNTVGGIEMTASGSSPTEALFMAIMKVIENEN